MKDHHIDISSTPGIVTPANQVARYIVTSGGPEGGLDLTVESGAGVHLVVPYMLERAKYKITVGTGAQFTFSLVCATSITSMSDIDITLAGEQARVNLELALVGLGSTQTELNLRLSHQARATCGRIRARRVLLHEAHSKLKGLLYVGDRAHITDAYLSDKSLLLGEHTEAVSEPQLEILADDVKASHGASIGRLGDEELFYLRSRGLPKSTAESMLVQAFLSPALVGVPLPIRHRFFHEVSIGQDA